MLHYYSPASELSHRTRKKKKPKTQSKSSQSLFSVILTVNHGLVALQAHATVNAQPFVLIHLQHPPGPLRTKDNADSDVALSRKRTNRC